jgi:cardiolipin synthase A/B
VPRRQRLRAYNCVTPLVGGGEAFPAMLEEIRTARRHVHLEMYILRDDVVGREFHAAFLERAKAGVEVRLLYDGLGSFALSSRYVDELVQAGVEVQVFHPVAPWRARWGLNNRDHQKILVVDDEVAFCGGINIGGEYRPLELGGGGWHDLHARVEGPAVFDLARIFRDTWIKAGGPPFPEPQLPLPRPDLPRHTALVEVISNDRLRTRSRMRFAYLHAIRRAQSTIHLMNAYFIPDRGLRSAFARAVRRGVEVSVIVPSTSDVRAVYHASRHLYTRLLKRGVRIFEWPKRMMHAKGGVIDGVWTTIGSYNLDRRSFLHNLEVALVSIDRDLGQQMERQFQRDLALCKEITLDEWQRRSWWSKALSWFFYQLRYWL